MTNKIIVKRSKPSFFSILAGLSMFYFTYNYYSKGSLILGSIAGILALIAIIHFTLLLTTPLLVQKDDLLIIKPKIPFEKKTLLIEEIQEVKANSEKQLIIIMEDKSKLKLDLGGFKKKEVEEAKAYLISLL